MASSRFSLMFLVLLVLLSFSASSAEEEDTWRVMDTTRSLPSWQVVPHGYMNIISCGIVIPLIAFTGRHRRFFPADHDWIGWKVMHLGLSGVAVLIVGADWFMLRSIISFSSLHSWLGIFILVIGVIQLVLGMLQKFRRAHKICGILVLVASVLNCFEGIYLMKVTSSIRGVFTFFIVFTFILSIILDCFPASSTVTVHVQ